MWSRLPLEKTRVITTKYKGAHEFDSQQSFDIERYSKILWPTPRLIRHVNSALRETRSEVVFIDPLLPTGLISSRMHDVAKVLIVHGAEVTVPSRLYPSRPVVKKIAHDCDVILSAGNYAAREIVRALDAPIKLVRIPPGVDVDLFRPPTSDERLTAHERLCQDLGIEKSSRIVMSASRLVPRKGFDVAITALADLEKDIHLVIVGKGRDDKRLKSIAEKRGVSSRVHLVGSISHEKLIQTFHASDLFLMLCRDRWGSLEAEGFGIVFLEAAACGLPVIAGRSGGSEEALMDGRSGYVVDPQSVSEVRQSIRTILEDQELSMSMGSTGRAFVERDHSYDHLAGLLLPLVRGDLSSARTFDG